MVYRIFVEKKKDQAAEGRALLAEWRDVLGVKALTGVRVLHRYDVEGIERPLFDRAVKTVFSEPPVDLAVEEPDLAGARVFAVEYLPGQFDQRADSAEQCIRILSPGAEPSVRCAEVYALTGDLSDGDMAKIRSYAVNPVDQREATAEKPETLRRKVAAPGAVEILHGFRDLDEKGLDEFRAARGLAMDRDDLAFCRDYFRAEKRDPTLTEIRVADTYWSDHCRHTTFLTVIDKATFEDELLEKTWQRYRLLHDRLRPRKPLCLMDLATIAVKALKEDGRLPDLDESEEINACTVKMKITVDGKEEPWLLLFK
ncbi:MAG: phosphoribosylformylglycinamidine synthase, partial [Clostridia bacterium]|nr:phosphoribosylformylglycinamidine synthase [Clostridia bacterium]